MFAARESKRVRIARAPQLRQLTFHRRGGKRRGAGRKPKGPRALVSHAARPMLAQRSPVLVTSRLRAGLPSLRRKDAFDAITAAFAACTAGADRHGMRLVHFSIQSNHLHLIVEARDAPSLARGMQGLLVRIARGLNRTWKRKGSVFSDRYHAHNLRTPREVRNALAYVLNNARKHGCHRSGVDPFSSGGAFEGWKEGNVQESRRSSATRDRCTNLAPRSRLEAKRADRHRRGAGLLDSRSTRDAHMMCHPIICAPTRMIDVRLVLPHSS
jgi:putative transposase